MRLATVETRHSELRIFPAALLDDQRAIDLTMAGRTGASFMKLRTMQGLIEAGPAAWDAARALVEHFRDAVPGERPFVYALADLHLLAPLPEPRSLRDFYAFEQHVKTANANRGRETPPAWYEIPVFYFSNHLAVKGPDALIQAPPGCDALDYELEVAAVIGRAGRDITPEAAEDHIFGYMIFNDWSARDFQRQEVTVGLGPAKGKDFASSLGPWIVTPEDLQEFHTGRPGVYHLEMKARVNGEERSRGDWADIHYSFGEIVARASAGVTLQAGEVIGSGTVGSGCLLELTAGKGPWLQPGDLVELEIDRLGVLTNRVGE